MTLKNVFPNPFDDKVKVEYKLPGSAVKATLNVTNLKGLRVSQQELTLGSTESELNVSELPKGIYLFQIATESGKSIAFKGMKK